MPREAFGLFLVSCGVFFTAAFVTGRGALLGRAGRVAVTYLMGEVGLALAPLVALAGALSLMRRLSRRRTAGVTLILLATAAALAARIPAAGRFDPGLYSRNGGLVGSALYSLVYGASGFVGVIFFLALLYLAGFYLMFPEVAVSLPAAVAGLTKRTRRSFALRRPRIGGKSERGDDESAREVRTAAPEKPAPEVRRDDAGFEIILPARSKEPSARLEELPERVAGDYTPPPISLLEPGSGEPEHDAEGTSRLLTQALADLGVEAQVVRAVVGPRVTRYELRLGSGVKVSKISNLRQDIAYALAATEIRILAPIPGKSAVGVEVPNRRPATVTLGDVFQEYPGANDWALPVGLGKDISGRAVFFDLAEMPHLLVAGATGSGKSVMLSGLLTSLLLTTDPRQVKMVLIDPKRVEFSQFARVPHLITPVVTDVKKASNALSWAVAEMERRYEILEEFGTRSLDGYNSRAEKQLPYVVVVIDELADLMMSAAAKVEDAVIRLAQKARAVGIHLVVATQRPSVDVITGMIKSNVPSRIAFAVSSQVDSRVILDTPGAEALLGRGDMLFKPVTALRPSRVQGAFISEAEVERVVSACAERASARYIEEVTQPTASEPEDGEPEDELLPEAANFVVTTRQASVSAIQRRFRVGYSRAGRIIDALERKGVVGPYEGSKSRAVVAGEADLPTIFGGEPEGDREVEGEEKGAEG
ncbi:MAG: DNA translocase FtsK [Rubrobacteraceae bacterium]|nr:DNA translocase FtsK [Rubrobacteraceae bacterium]